MLCYLVQLEVPQIKAEMEKTLQWLAPMASNTLKYDSGLFLFHDAVVVDQSK